MLAEYRRRLERELDLLGNAGHDPYSLGQANMAKRALEMLGEEFIGGVVLSLTNQDATAVATELAALEMAGGDVAARIARLRRALMTALTPPQPPAP